METTLTVPKVIEEVILKFDATDSAIDPHKVSQALKEARNSLDSPTDAENLGAWSEVLAFTLVECRHTPSPWQTYFGPVFSGKTQEGKDVYRPDIVDAPPETIAHWEWRAQSLRHPVLRARYADLAWDMSRAIAKKGPNPEMARIAIEAYLLALSNSTAGDIHHRFEAAIRSLDLAIMLDDAGRKDRARAALLSIHAEVMSAKKGLWWLAFNQLVDNKAAGTTEDETAKLVADLEAVVTRCSNFSNTEEFDPHFTKDASDMLIKTYRKRQKGQEIRRLQEVVGKTFEHVASMSDALLASSFLQTAVNAYRDAGLKDDSTRMRVAMEQKLLESRKQMTPIITKGSIPTDDIEKWLQSVVRESMGDTLGVIAIACLHIRRQLEEKLAEEAKEAPLTAMLTHHVLAGERVAAKVGSVEDDQLGRVIQKSMQVMAFGDLFLTRAIEKAIETHGIQPGHFASWSARTGLFDDLTLLMEGIDAWYAGDNVKALHILVPQVEVALRRLVGNSGRPVTKQHPTLAGVSVAITMGDILYNKEITSILGPDITLHLSTLYADPRGINLRNDLAHGLLPAGRMTYALASRVVHTLLVLGIWEDIVEVRKAQE